MVQKENEKKEKKTPKDKKSQTDLSDEDSSAEAGVFDTVKKKKKIDEIAEDIDYEYPDIP